MQILTTGGITNFLPEDKNGKQIDFKLGMNSIKKIEPKYGVHFKDQIGSTYAIENCCLFCDYTIILLCYNNKKRAVKLFKYNLIDEDAHSCYEIENSNGYKGIVYKTGVNTINYVTTTGESFIWDIKNNTLVEEARFNMKTFSTLIHKIKTLNNDIYYVGSNRTVLKKTNNNLKDITSAVDKSDLWDEKKQKWKRKNAGFNTIYIDENGKTYAVGNAGEFYIYDTKWTKFNLKTSASLTDIVVIKNNIYIIGSNVLFSIIDDKIKKIKYDNFYDMYFLEYQNENYILDALGHILIHKNNEFKVSQNKFEPPKHTKLISFKNRIIAYTNYSASIYKENSWSNLD